MFIFERVGCEPEKHIEDYSINYDNNEEFIINDYYDEGGYDRAIIPVVSINRERMTVELYDFAYTDARPSDKPKILKAIIELVELKEELNITSYRVIGEGASAYYSLYNNAYI